MSTTQILIWSAFALLLMLAFVFGFVALIRKLAPNPIDQFLKEVDDERAERRHTVQLSLGAPDMDSTKLIVTAVLAALFGLLLAPLLLVFVFWG